MLLQHIQFILCSKKLNSISIKHRIPRGCRVSNWEFSHTRQRESWLFLSTSDFFFISLFTTSGRWMQSVSVIACSTFGAFFWRKVWNPFWLWKLLNHWNHVPCATKWYLLVLFEDVSEWGSAFLKGLFRYIYIYIQENTLGYGFGRLNGRYESLLKRSLLQCPWCSQ